MKFYAFIVSLFVSTLCFAQPTVMEFDGVDDHIDLGSSVGDGVRTIEFWFKLAEDITPTSLSDKSSMVIREVNAQNNEEFHISFEPPSQPTPGKLRFLYSTNNVNGKYDVVSDVDTWTAGIWHHVAGVIDPNQGMMLFVDGVKQADTEPGYTSPTAAASDVTAIGGYAKTFTTRNFKGRIDDVRFSTAALYNADFTPPCPDIEATGNSNGVYNFNLGTGTTAIDSSNNNYDGTLMNGPTWAIDTICEITEEPNTGNAIEFDGVDDYIDLGNTVGDGVRTIEFWFKLAEDITPTSLSDKSSMVIREVNAQNNEEFHISFEPPSQPTPGKLRFLYSTNNVNGKYDVVSDVDTWTAGIWHHVAGVIDPNQGMMLFVDGVKQADTEPGYTSPTAAASDVTAIGGYAKTFTTRNFKGRIDDVRFSSDAVYSSNFTPPCPDITATGNTIGLYNMNDSGTTATDSTSNNYHGTLMNGATWVTDSICTNETGIDAIDTEQNAISIYPNPSSGTFIVRSKEAGQFTVTDLQGRFVATGNLNESFNMANHAKGVYLVRYKDITQKVILAH